MSAGTEPGSEETCDDFLGGRLSLLQPRRGHRSGSDAVLLAAAVPASGGQRIVDLGTGCGAGLLCLLSRIADCSGAGIDIDPASIDRARRNAARNGLGTRAEFHTDDVRRRLAAIKPGSADHVMANPPYFTEGDGPAAAEASRAAARSELAAGPIDWLKRAGDVLRHGGCLTLIQRTERLPDLLAACAGRFGAIEIHPLWSEAGAPAKRFILRAIKDSRAPLRLCPGLILHRDGAYAPEAEAVLRDGAALFTAPG